jgi:hypothetical protein
MSESEKGGMGYLLHSYHPTTSINVYVPMLLLSSCSHAGEGGKSKLACSGLGSLQLHASIFTMMSRFSSHAASPSGGAKKRTISPRSFRLRRKLFQRSFSSSALDTWWS